MNILIVGNGFDLAHGLPTRYSDYVHQISEELDFEQYLGERYEIDKESYQLFIRVKSPPYSGILSIAAKMVGWILKTN